MVKQLYPKLDQESKTQEELAAGVNAGNVVNIKIPKDIGNNKLGIMILYSAFALVLFTVLLSVKIKADSIKNITTNKDIAFKTFTERLLVAESFNNICRK